MKVSFLFIFRNSQNPSVLAGRALHITTELQKKLTQHQKKRENFSPIRQYLFRKHLTPIQTQKPS